MSTLADIFASDFRKLYRLHGERVAWYKALNVPAGTAGAERNGCLYTQQSLDSAIRIFLHSQQQIVEHPDFGTIQSGTMMMSSLPDEVWPGWNDRFVAIDRTVQTRSMITRGDSASDTFANAQVIAVNVVRDSDVVYVAGADYAVTTTGITWLDGNGPAAGAQYSVEYLYHPLYIFLGEVHSTKLDPLGFTLPVTVPLSQEHGA